MGVGVVLGESEEDVRAGRCARLSLNRRLSAARRWAPWKPVWSLAEVDVSSSAGLQLRQRNLDLFQIDASQREVPALDHELFVLLGNDTVEMA